MNMIIDMIGLYVILPIAGYLIGVYFGYKQFQKNYKEREKTEAKIHYEEGYLAGLKEAQTNFELN